MTRNVWTVGIARAFVKYQFIQCPQLRLFTSHRCLKIWFIFIHLSTRYRKENLYLLRIAICYSFLHFLDNFANVTGICESHAAQPTQGNFSKHDSDTYQSELQYRLIGKFTLFTMWLLVSLLQYLHLVRQQMRRFTLRKNQYTSYSSYFTIFLLSVFIIVEQITEMAQTDH